MPASLIREASVHRAESWGRKRQKEWSGGSLNHSGVGS